MKTLIKENFLEFSKYDYSVSRDDGVYHGNDGIIQLPSKNLILYQKYKNDFLTEQSKVKNKRQFKQFLESINNNQPTEINISTKLHLSIYINSLITNSKSFVTDYRGGKTVYNDNFDFVVYNADYGLYILRKMKDISIPEIMCLNEIMGTENNNFIENYLIKFLPDNLIRYPSSVAYYPNVYKYEKVMPFINRFEKNERILSFMQSYTFREIAKNGYPSDEEIKKIDELFQNGKKRPLKSEYSKVPYPELSQNEKRVFIADLVKSKNIILKNDITKIQEIIELMLEVNSLYDDGSLTKTKGFWKKKGIETKEFPTFNYNKKISGLEINEKDYILEMGFYNYNNINSDQVLEHMTFIFKNDILFDDIKKIVKYFDITAYKAGNSRYLDNGNNFYEQLNGEDFINMYGNVPYTALLQVIEINKSKYVKLYCSKGNRAFPFDLNKNKFQSETIRKMEDFEFLKIQKSYQHSIDVLTKFGESLETWLHPSSNSLESSNSSEKKVGSFNDFKKNAKLQYQGELGKVFYVDAQEKCPCSKYELNTGSRDRNNNRNGGVMALPYFTIYKTSQNKWYNLSKEKTYSTYDELLLAIYYEDYE
ncbi:MAG: hypothetical protein U0V04_19465 [Spirosomataceae bacterium]